MIKCILFGHSWRYFFYLPTRLALAPVPPLRKRTVSKDFYFWLKENKMKRILRLDENDIRELVAKEYEVPIDNVITTITEEPDYHEEMVPMFYVEVELKGE